MAEPHIPDLPRLALALAEVLPTSTALAVASALELHSGTLTPGACAEIAADIAQPQQRAAVTRFLASWATTGTAPEVAAMAIRTAACAVNAHRAENSTELVWTGPNPEGLPFRRTDQALLEVIDAAQQTLTVVTFAAYKVPAVAEALVRAASRGVRIRIVVESAQASEGKIAYEAIDALGPKVAKMAEVYVWPTVNRPVDAEGHHGSLHAKCAIADDTHLFLSSANLTAYALTLNMELGVLVCGGPAPRAIDDHFTRLIANGVLESVRQHVVKNPPLFPTL